MVKMEFLEEGKKLKNYFIEQPSPIFQKHTIQIILLREILDFAIFRTEESKELNTIVTPSSIDNKDPLERVAFLGGKQKAVESRELASLIRTAANEVDYDIDECYLKDYLCLQCPRCGLYGGTSTSSAKRSDSNIKHRISYSTAYSLRSYEELQESITFNGINDKDVTTGQALGTKRMVSPASFFPSVITLRAITWKEFIWIVKTILSAHQYGAESRTGGDVRNNIIGITAGWEEVITSLELTLELAATIDEDINMNNVKNILEKYKKYTANTSKITILDNNEISTLLEEIQNFELDKEFIKESFKDIDNYRKKQGE